MGAPPSDTRPGQQDGRKRRAIVLSEMLLDEPLQARFVLGPNADKFDAEFPVGRPHDLGMIHRDGKEVDRHQQVQLDPAPDRHGGVGFNSASGPGQIDHDPFSGHVFARKGAGALDLDSC